VIQQAGIHAALDAAVGCGAVLSAAYADSSTCECSTLQQLRLHCWSWTLWNGSNWIIHLLLFVRMLRLLEASRPAGGCRRDSCCRELQFQAAVACPLLRTAAATKEPAAAVDGQCGAGASCCYDSSSSSCRRCCWSADVCSSMLGNVTPAVLVCARGWSGAGLFSYASCAAVEGA
jgi:hypothetical protein